MNRFSTILSLIFIIAFANSTKMVSFSDIVYSLMDITDDSQKESLKQVGQVSETFQKTRTQLLNLDKTLLAECLEIKKEGETSNKNYETQLSEIGVHTVKVVESNKAIAVEMQGLNKRKEEYLVEARTTGLEILSSKKYMIELENSITDRVGVLLRLKNIVQDELTASKRNSELEKISVNKKLSGYSFLEFENIQDSLRTLLESSDAITKSMITTLITLSQANKKALFSDPTTVGKINVMIEEIINKSKMSLVNSRKANHGKIFTLERIMNHARREVEKIEEKLLSLYSATMANNQDIILSKANAVEVQKNVKRAARQNANFANMCSKQNDLLKRNIHTLENIVSKFQVLKSDLE